jgi:hypothetical protein
MRKLYNAPAAELIKIDTKDIMSISRGGTKDPYTKDIWGIIGGVN